MSGCQLRRLTEEGRHLVSDAYLRGDSELKPADFEEYAELHPSGMTYDHETLRTVVDDTVDRYGRYDTSMDGAVAQTVHETLDVSRRVAGDPGIWHYLAVVEFPEFVRYRWQYNSEEAMREKFLGAGTDLYSNALHRLWWIAELTSDGDNYSLTERIFSNQTMVNKVFDRWFARYRPATAALCDELADAPSWVIDEVTRDFNHKLSTVQLEGLSKDEARRLVGTLRNNIKQQR